MSVLNGRVDVVTAILPNTATYQITLRDNSGSANFIIEADLIVDDSSNAFEDAQQLFVDGRAQTLSFEYIGDRDLYAFDVEAGESITFNLDDEQFDSFSIIDSQGERVISSIIDGYGYTLDDPGLYYLAAEARGYLGTREMSANIYTDDFTDDVNTVGYLELDGSKIQGDLETLNDIDWIAFSVEAGDIVDFQVLVDDSLLQIDDTIKVSRLFNADGVSMGGLFFPRGGAEVNVGMREFSEGGTYYLQVTSSSPEEVDRPYSLRATRHFTDDHGDDESTATSIALDTSTTAVVDYLTDHDYFSFQAEAGVLYSATATNSEGEGLFATLYMRTAAGQRTNGENYVIGAQRDGIAYFDVRDSSFYGEPYEVLITELEDDYLGAATTQGVIGTGSPVSGQINSSADTDWFRMDIELNEHVLIEMTGEEGFGGKRLSVFDSSGRYIDGVLQRSALEDASFQFTADTSGPYYLSASSGSGASEGNYTLQMTTIPVFNVTSGNDEFYGSIFDDEFAASDGDDAFFGLAGEDRLLGGNGNDYLSGGDGNDFIDGGEGNDILIAGNGSDTIYGRGGDDYIYLGPSLSVFYGGDGYDTVIATDLYYREIRLIDLSVERVFGTHVNDYIDLSDVTDYGVTMYGYGGIDTLIGSNQNDYIYFDADDLNGGRVSGLNGFDYAFHNAASDFSGTMTFDMGASQIEGYYGTPLGTEIIDASGVTGYVTTIYTNGGADTVIGSTGTDYVYVTGQEASISGGAGFDYAIYNVFDGSGYTLNMTATGFEGAIGRGGNDRFDASGSTVSTSQYGYGGDDILIGGEETDYLLGDSGDDTYTGNGGTDYFYHDGVFGADTITDFTIGTDYMVVRTAGVSSFANVLVVQDGADALITIGANSIRLTGVTVTEITADAFIFDPPSSGQKPAENDTPLSSELQDDVVVSDKNEAPIDDVLIDQLPILIVDDYDFAVVDLI